MTDRLRIQRVRAFSPPGNVFPRIVFLGWIEEVDYPVCVATYCDSLDRLEMIWTHPFFQRRGYALEMLRYLWREGYRFSLDEDTAVRTEGEKLLHRFRAEVGE